MRARRGTWPRPVRRALRRLRGWPDLEGLQAAGMQLGSKVFVGGGTFLDPPFCWLISIGDETTISIDVMVLAHDASTKRHLGYSRIAPVTIGRRCFIGARSIILPGVTIGDEAVVGAGSVVSRDVPSRTIVAGSPARPVLGLDEYLERHEQRMRTRTRWSREWTVNGGITPERKREVLNVLAREGEAYIA